MTRSGSVSLNSSKGVEAQRGLNVRLLCLCRGLKIAANRKCAKTGLDRVFWTEGCVDGKVILESMLSVDCWCLKRLKLLCGWDGLFLQANSPRIFRSSGISPHSPHTKPKIFHKNSFMSMSL
jgi:hypothetical protein